MSSVATANSTQNTYFMADLPIKYPELNGALLGRNGSEIRKLKEQSEHQFRIKLYNKDDSSRNTPLFSCTNIKVESTSEEGLRDAVRILKERIKILKENRTQREMDRDNESNMVLKLNFHHKSMLIGRGGSNIKSLETENHCRINIGNEQDENGYVDVKVSCKDEDLLQRACENIKLQISNYPIFHILRVESKDVSKIIGVKGVNIKTILNNQPENTYISYKKELNGFHIIANNQDTVDSVVSMINEFSSKKEKRMITENLFWDSEEE